MSSTAHRLTAISLSALKPGCWASDAAERGAGRLAARRTGSGVVFYFRYAGGQGRRHALPLGAFDPKGRDGLTLSEARARAGTLSRRYRAGERDLRGALWLEQREHERAIEAERATEAAAAATVGALLLAYCDGLDAAGKPSAPAVRAMILKHAKPSVLWRRTAAAFTARDAVALLHPLVAAGKRRQAAKLRSALRAAFRRAAQSHTDPNAPEALRALGVEIDPLAALVTVEGANKARDRALSAAELRAYWKRLQALPDPAGALLRLHLLTGGQRLQQLARGTVEDIAEGVLILYDGKGRRSEPRRHPVPLIPEALAEIDRLGAGELGPFVYTLTRGATAADYSATRERLRPVVAAMVEAGEVAEPFTLGDLRRTVETRLAALGIGADVRARLQSHGLGGIQARHYDRHDYAEEVRAALERLRELLTGEGGKVTPIRRRPAAAAD